MHIRCTNGTPDMDTLDHLPPLPLLLGYRFTISEQDESGIYQALQLHGRVRHIYLDLPPSALQKCLKLMDGYFPILENLSLSFAVGQLTHHTLPKAFLAPHLHHLDLTGVGLPKRLRLLTSTVSLVTLQLRNIPSSSYFRPRLLAARLSSLLQLEELSIGFSIPIPRPSAEREQLGEQGTPFTLPNLKLLSFKGVGSYLDCLVAQIITPLLERLDVTLFNQIVFAFPHLWHLINSKEGFQLPLATVYFEVDAITISTCRYHWRPYDAPFWLRVKCKQFDWQIDCAAQICSALITILSGVEKLSLESLQVAMPGVIDSTSWHELLRSFIGVKQLVIKNPLLGELSRALKLDDVGSDPGFLPNLQDIVAKINYITSFIDSRRVLGRPVQFTQLLRGPRQPAPFDLPRPSCLFEWQPPGRALLGQ
jgi:hypothetical protein